MNQDSLLLPQVVGPPLAGLIILVLGLPSVREEWTGRFDAVTLLGRVFVAAPLAVFGAEHLLMPSTILVQIPTWMPGRIFWVYFVGVALEAAAFSLITRHHSRLAASLLGVMFFLFVLLMHVENVAQDPHDRFAWAIMLRDTSFGIGAWALATIEPGGARWRPGHVALVAGRIAFALILIVYGVEHLLHPTFIPGVPLSARIPTVIPGRPVWGCAVGLALLVTGLALLFDRYAGEAATWLGIILTAVVVAIEFPMLLVAGTAMDITTAVNYVFDTLLFAGCVLLVARAVALKGMAEPVRFTLTPVAEPTRRLEPADRP